MPYEYLEDVAMADIAFHAAGTTVEELFAACADATLNVMVEDLSTVRERERVPVNLENEALDLLLFSFLSELVYYKDAKGLLLRGRHIEIGRRDPLFTLRAELTGERLDPLRHPLCGDVKAVTLHRFDLRQSGDHWEATVVLDI